MLKRIYIDTSVIGGYYDKEFETHTAALFERIEAGQFIVLLSSITMQELEGAPRNVQALSERILGMGIENIAVNAQAVELANCYIAAKVVGRSSYADCLHIALASICRADYVVSWNFKHIVNEQRISGYNSINIQNGYQPLAICSPKTLLCYENTAHNPIL